MRGWFVILALTAAMAAGAATKTRRAGNAAKGQEVFGEQCSVCHDTTGTQRKAGPELKGLFKKSKMADGKAMNEANIRVWIHHGGHGMPAFPDLKGAELNNLMAYLRTI